MVTVMGCKQNSEKPSDLLPQDRMAKIIADQLIAEAFASQESLDLGISPVLLLDSLLYPELFRRHGVEQEVYRRSLTWYENDPRRLKALMADVIVLLEHRDSISLEAIPREVPLPAMPRDLRPEDFKEMLRKRQPGAGASE